GDSSPDSIDYRNTHGTSTPAGDVQELKSIKHVFGEKTPLVNSTKSLSGHSLGAAGAQEAIYSLLMMENDYAYAAANIENLDAEAAGVNMPLQRVGTSKLKRIMSCSFGFGGSNACLAFDRFSG